MKTSLNTAAIRCATITGRKADRAGKHVVDTLARKPYLSMLQRSPLCSHSEDAIPQPMSRLTGQSCQSAQVQRDERPSRMVLRSRWLPGSEAREPGYGMNGNVMRIQKTLKPGIFTVV